MKYEVEKDIPIPENFRGESKKFPFREMSPGDSFAVPVGTRKPTNVRNSIRAALKRDKGVDAGNFTVLYLKDENVVRCWKNVWKLR